MHSLGLFVVCARRVAWTRDEMAKTEGEIDAATKSDARDGCDARVVQKKTDSSLFSKEAHFMGEAEEWVLQGFGGRGALVRLPAHHPSQQVDEFSEE